MWRKRTRDGYQILQLMERDQFQYFLKVIQTYYHLGAPRLPNDFNLLTSKIEEKLNRKSNLAIKWAAVMKEIKELKQAQAHDLSFIQFPNLQFILEQPKDLGEVRCARQFVFCISLLSPYYTYYCNYLPQVKTADGKWFALPPVTFYNESELQLIKPDNSVIQQSIDIVKSKFDDLTYIDHYQLMLNKVTGAYPYGLNDGYELRTEFSIFEFLFNYQQNTKIYP